MSSMIEQSPDFKFNLNEQKAVSLDSIAVQEENKNQLHLDRPQQEDRFGEYIDSEEQVRE